MEPLYTVILAVAAETIVLATHSVSPVSTCECASSRINKYFAAFFLLSKLTSHR